MKSGKNGKSIKGLKISSSKQTNLIIKHGFSSAVRRVEPNTESSRLFAELDWTKNGFSSAVRRAGPVQFGERPSRTQHGFSLAVHRAGSTADAVPPFAELDQSSLANGRAGPKTDSTRPFAELDPRCIPIGCSPS
ncbi:hypothetical protein DY000_02040948 [Brassica cretica]|uniref:Uncharacterized protein n=1 Tax=Brassica cretica TaxID=69181 RepID=A0ABQ7BMV1_BRACR|nr:hypothetical protein DY000_02040948 [Brassica cretica]